jgi:hypothetical protein
VRKAKTGVFFLSGSDFLRTDRKKRMDDNLLGREHDAPAPTEITTSTFLPAKKPKPASSPAKPAKKNNFAAFLTKGIFLFTCFVTFTPLLIFFFFFSFVFCHFLLSPYCFSAQSKKRPLLQQQNIRKKRRIDQQKSSDLDHDDISDSETEALNNEKELTKKMQSTSPEVFFFFPFFFHYFFFF